MINDHPENPPPHLTFVKGYTNQGFKGQAYHIHNHCTTLEFMVKK